ncbi:MAG: permease [Myxococcales bacterium]|nr:permease [Myxococcales bacterium]
MLEVVWSILVELAPWLLLGAAVAGALHVLLPADFVRRHLRGRSGVLKAIAVGVPLPLCSCGVIPAGLGLKKDGASDGASVGFLISTPQTGVDSILVSASFLGWPFALFKVFSAAITGLVGGGLVDAFGGGRKDAPPPPPSCAEAAPPRTVRAAVAHGVEMLQMIWGWLVVGVLVSAAITLWLPHDLFTRVEAIGTGLSALLVLVVSVPMYVCATASVPIAAALVGAGMPLGAALVFLMAGPATNVATIGAVGRAFGRRVLGLYLGTLVFGSLLLGWAFDFVLADGAPTGVHDHVHGAAWWAVASAVVLVGLLAWFAATDLAAWLRRWRAAPDVGVTLGVDGMKCNACVRKVEGAVGALPGVTAVAVQREPDQVVVHGAVTRDQIVGAIQSAGFRPRDAA